MNLRFLSCLLIVLLLGCSTARKAAVEQNTVIKEKASPQILFINLNMYKDAASTVKAELINKIITKGSIKGNRSVATNEEYLCVQYDQKSTPLDSLTLEDPFVKNVEYINSQGAFERKQIELDSCQVSLRMQLADQANYVAILHKNQLITKIKL